jgi:hypothetical protein
MENVDSLDKIVELAEAMVHAIAGNSEAFNANGTIDWVLVQEIVDFTYPFEYSEFEFEMATKLIIEAAMREFDENRIPDGATIH